MTDIGKLDKGIQDLIVIKNKLNTLDYNSEEYDLLEEKLHDQEDKFIEEFGEYMDDVLHNVHDEFCPDNDVLLSTAYLAKQYTISADNEYDIAFNEGIFVDADDFPGKNTRLAILPNPVRIVLNIDKNTRETLWTATS